MNESILTNVINTCLCISIVLPVLLLIWSFCKPSAFNIYFLGFLLLICFLIVFGGLWSIDIWITHSKGSLTQESFDKLHGHIQYTYIILIVFMGVGGMNLITTGISKKQTDHSDKPQ